MEAKEVILKHIEEYNKCDIEKCLAYVSDDIEVTILPSNEVLFNSKDVLAGHLKAAFAEEDRETVEVVKIMEFKNCVTTVEKKTKVISLTSRELLITYLVENSKISKMWAIR
mgnify:CR=1 FL=1|jgi:hypothetical protein